MPGVITSGTGSWQSDLMIAALRDGAVLADLSGREWTELIKRARLSMLLGKIAGSARAAGVFEGLPEGARRALEEAEVAAAENARMLRWEANRIERALLGSDIQPIILKGGAYIIGDLRAGHQRLASDIDILVAKHELDTVEAAMGGAGWQAIKSNEYDDHYYREWMHELPPMRHVSRYTMVDIHHTILPLTGRLQPDAQALLSAAVPLPGSACRMLAPTDMVLHSAVHLFQDSDFAFRLRDLLDLHQLLSEFGVRDGFWDELGARADVHGLQRPLYYALSFAAEVFGTEIPTHVLAAAAKGRPAWPIAPLMQGLIRRAMPPEDELRPITGLALARWLLFLRSHWLRMPPVMLARHLIVKFFRRFQKSKS